MGKVDVNQKNEVFGEEKNFSLIEGVTSKLLREIPVEGGPVLHMVKSSDPEFSGFGEIYFSLVEPCAVKGWKRHKQQTQLFAVPYGHISVVLYDDREESSSRGCIAQYTLGRPDSYILLRIPPMIWYSFASNGKNTAILANCANMPHDPQESDQLPLNSPLIPFSWRK